MIRKTAIGLAVAAMLFGPLVTTASAAEKPAKVPKIKLEPLKPGKIKLDPRLGYILVRMGPSNASEKPTPVAFVRINAATGKPFEPGDEEAAVPNFDRTVLVVVNAGRSFGEVDGQSVYLLSAYPGQWIISNVGETCLSLGTYQFEVKQGEVADIGSLWTAREDGKSAVPQLAGVTLSQDLVEFGTMMNIVMSTALFAAPADGTPALPAELASFPVSKAALSPDFRMENRCQGLINRAASLPPMESAPPMTQAEALAAIDKMNPPDRVEAARKRAAQKAASAAAAK